MKATKEYKIAPNLLNREFKLDIPGFLSIKTEKPCLLHIKFLNVSESIFILYCVPTNLLFFSRAELSISLYFKIF